VESSFRQLVLCEVLHEIGQWRNAENPFRMRQFAGEGMVREIVGYGSFASGARRLSMSTHSHLLGL
jgi:hypothetical protein